MRLTNSNTAYGLVSMFFHWASVPVVIAMFALGLWMHDLDYDSPWYKTAPHIHRSIGVLFIGFILLRLLWKFFTKSPDTDGPINSWERRVARWVQAFMYVLLILLLPSGYFITTAKGQALDVFNWFSVPALVTHIENLENIAGDIHELIAFVLIGLVSLHALAALKHHFVNRDNTLKRMLGKTE